MASGDVFVVGEPSVKILLNFVESCSFCEELIIVFRRIKYSSSPSFKRYQPA